MLDKHILADRVSHLLKTRYAHLAAKELPFHQAFTDVMNESGVCGDSRGLLKSDIGKILAARPKRPRKKKNEKTEMQQTQFSFAILNADRIEVILTNPIDGEKICFRRNKTGMVVNTWFTGRVTGILLARANEAATKIFADKDRAVVRHERMRFCFQDRNHILVTIDDKYHAYISRGLRARAVAATITCNGKFVAQKEVPADLLREARAIAKQYFKGRDTLPLQFE